jgi:signal transduction histidine kinase
MLRLGPVSRSLLLCLTLISVAAFRLNAAGAGAASPAPPSNDYFAHLGLMSWQTYLLLLQIPIVAFLGISALQAGRAFRQKGFVFVAVGWISNLIYIGTSHFAALQPPPTFARPALFTTIADFFNMAAALFFWWACDARRPAGLTRTWRIAIFVGFVVIIPYNVFFFRPLLASLGWIAAVPRVVASIFGSGALLYFYVTLHPKEPQPQRSLLMLGLWAYYVIQPLYLSGFFWSSALPVGFAAGLLAKVCIAFGVVGYLVTAAAEGVRAEDERVRIKDLTGTIGQILHEIGTPVSLIGVHSTKLVETAPRGAFHSHLQALEGARLLLAATLEAARRLMPYPDILIKLRDVAATTFQGIPHLSEEQVISANTLAQLALMAVKETRAEKKIKIYPLYSGNCCLRCVPIEITQALINLLRNAYDAMPNGVGTVRLETRTGDQDGGASSIQINVVDDGEGIAPARQVEVFQRGVTTRGGIGRGYGLAAVKELVEKNHGAVEVKSPATTSKERPGTAMTLKFPRVACGGAA